MSKFSGPFLLKPSDDERTALVHTSFSYYSDLLGRKIVIPKNFLTDGASVPRLFWSIIPPWGRYGRAAVVHDYLYRWQKTSRRQADDTLLEAMWVSDCKAWEYLTIWFAVRLFGWRSWSLDKSKPLSAEEISPNS